MNSYNVIPLRKDSPPLEEILMIFSTSEKLKGKSQNN